MLELDVFLEAQPTPVGRLARDDHGDIAFRYLRDDLPHPISASLPVREKPFGDHETRGFFDNLLFENAQRDQIMQRHGLDHSDTVGLLYHLGRDCPGAISVVPSGVGPAKQPGNLDTDYDPLDDDALSALMISLRDRRRVPDGTGDPSPLAGVQGKVALAMLPDGRFGFPRQGLNVPTTHILKVPRAAEMRLVDHEHVSMQIARDVLAHPVADTSILEFEDVRGLLVERFDRQVEDAQVRRIHQEDFCQALGLGPALKYERNGIGERAFSARCVGDLILSCDSPGQTRQAFLEGTLVNLLLGNTDNHAKNHSLLYRGARPQLAPFYDIVPVLLDDQVTHQMSFKIGAAEMTDDITAEDVARFLQDLGYRRMTPKLKSRLCEIVSALVARVPEMRGPGLKRLGDAIAEQARWLGPAIGCEVDIPDRDLVIINRP